MNKNAIFLALGVALALIVSAKDDDTKNDPPAPAKEPSHGPDVAKALEEIRADVKRVGKRVSKASKAAKRPPPPRRRSEEPKGGKSEDDPKPEDKDDDS